ncbi:MAG: HAD hydrolase-like protein [Ruminococcus sp.]|nr:HAD hydrolase-like protein [Ruminococcus sp.]
MKCRYDYVLFDLDGTLSASAPGIRRCIELTLQHMGKEVPDLSDYSRYIGPPLIKTFMGLCGLSEDEAKYALSYYLKIYDTEGECRNRLFEGIPEMLSKLRDSNAKVAVCSSKFQGSVDKVCAFLDILGYFDALCGSDGTGKRREKEDIIPYAMQTLGAVKGDRVVMIGDTFFDAKGAVYNNVDFIGVTYGYGRKDMMEAEGATLFADDVSQLMALLFE